MNVDITIQQKSKEKSTQILIWLKLTINPLI